MAKKPQGFGEPEDTGWEYQLSMASLMEDEPHG
jgi:hypothetical protein